MPYLAISIALFCCSLLVSPRPEARRLAYYFSLLFLFFFVAFRFEVGCDWSGYHFQYDKAYLLGLREALRDSEPGWWAILYALSSSNIYYPWINVVAAAVFFYGLHTLARRQPSPAFFIAIAFPVLIVNMPMSGIRQGAAIGIMCYAITCLTDGRWKRYVFLVFFAASIHNSALLFIVLTPLGVESLTPKARIVTMAAFAGPAVGLIVLGEAGQQAVDRYLDTGYDANGALYRLAMLSISGAYFFAFLRAKWREDYPLDYNLALFGSAALVCVIMVLPISSVVADRIGYYLIPIQAVVLARTINLTSLRPSPALALLISAVLIAFFYIWTSNSNNFRACYIPYQSWLYK